MDNNQQPNGNEESGINNEESGINNEESGVNNEESGINNEESSINEVMFSSENDDDKKVTVDCEADKDKTERSLISQNSMDEKENREEISKLVSRANELVQDTNQSNTTIPPNKKLTKKDLSSNADYIDVTKISHITPEEVFEKLRVVLNQPNGYSVEELAEKIANITNQIDSTADIKGYLKAIANKKVNDSASHYEIPGYNSARDFGYGMGDNEKFKSIIDSKHFLGSVDSSYTTLTVLPVGVNVNEHSKGEQPDEHPNQEQTENQEHDTSGQADVTSQGVQDSTQAVELSEDDHSRVSHPGMTELAIKVARIFELPDKSALVTGLSYFTYFTGNQHTPAICQTQQLVRIPTAGNIPVQTIIKVAFASVGCVSVWHYRICELLAPIVDVINDAERVLVIENIVHNLRTFIVQVVRMSSLITEVERDILSNGGCSGDLLLQMLEVQLTNQLRTIANGNLLNNNDIAEVLETCTSEQDTDVDDYMPEYFYSNAACCVDNNAEVLELFGCQCQMCAVLMHQRKYIVKQILSNPRCCSLLNNELLNRLANLVVNVNSHSKCYFNILRIDLPFEALQRNLIHGCQKLQTVVESTLTRDPVYLRRVLDSIMVNGLFINWSHLKSSQSIVDQQMPIGEHDVPLTTPEHAQIMNCAAHLQHCIDRLCSQFINPLSDDLYHSFASMLQPFILGAVVSKHISSYMESVQKSFSRLQHYFYCLVHSYANILPNTLTPKISISVTVVSGDISVTMEELNDFLRNCLNSRDQNCHITSLLRLPPASIINNEPMMIVANLMFTFPPTFFLQAGFIINPVDAVDLHNRESLVMVTTPTYGFPDDENSHNSIEESDVSFSDSSPNPNDHHKKIGYLDIFEHCLAENGPHEHHPPGDSDSPNENKVTHISVEATISDSSNPDQQV